MSPNILFIRCAPLAMVLISVILAGCATPYRTREDRQLAFQEANNRLNRAKAVLEKRREPSPENDKRDREARDDLMRARDILDRIFDSERNVTILLSLGQANRLLGDIDAAYRAYLYVVNNLDTNNVDALAELGSMALGAYSDPDKAKTFYQRIYNAEADNTEALFYLGYIDYRKSDYRAARSWFEKLIALPPSGQYRAYGELYLGIIEFYAGDYESCVKLIAPHYRYDADDAESVMFAIPLYKSYQITERYAEALAVLAPLEQEASNTAYTQEAAFLSVLAGKDPKAYSNAMRTGKESPPPYVLSAFMLAGGDVTNARGMLLRGESSLESLQLLWHIEQKLGNAERARKVELDLAVYYYQNDVFNMAIRHFTALTREKKYAYLWYDISMAYLKMDDAEHAVDAAARFLRADITHKLVALWDVSDFLMRRKKFADAHAGYDRIIKLYPDSTFAYLQKGVIYGMTGDAAAAQRMVSKARTLMAGEDDKGKKSAYFTIGTIELMASRPKDAVASLSKALALDPDDPNSLNALGYTYIDSGINVREGLSLVKKALSYKQSPHFYDSLGWGYYKEQRYEEAKKELLKALEGFSGEGLSVVYGHLGDVYGAMGDTANALDSYKKALDVEEKSVEFDEKAVREKVKQLEKRSSPVLR